MLHFINHNKHNKRITRFRCYSKCIHYSISLSCKKKENFIILFYTKKYPELDDNSFL